MMTSITGSPSPKPRTGRNNHRQTKSSSFIAAPNQFNPKHHAQQSHNNQLPSNTTHVPAATNYRGSNRSTVMTPPTTPKAQHFPNTNTDASGKKKKNKKQDKSKQEKTKPKNVATKVQAGFPSRPIPADLESPPMSSDEFPSGQITPPKMSSTPPSKAYAGPTFHHSPAPSALPMPKFFSKSVPGTPAGTSLQSMIESDVSDTTSSVTAPASVWQEQSQLELLFKAARAENMGMKRQGSGSTTSSDAATDSFSGIFGTNTDPESPIRSNRRVTRNIPHESLFFSMDEFDKPLSPLSPTFKERINQSRSVTAPSKMPTQSSLEEEKRKETANALKQYLLSPQSPARKASVSSPSPASRTQNRPSPQFKAGPPLSLNRGAYQPQSPRSPAGTGYFPMFPSSPTSFPFEQQVQYTAQMHTATPPRGPSTFRPSHQAHFSPVDNISTYMTPQQFSGVPLYHNNHNSILASKLEAVTGPVIQQSVTDLENDLRRVLMI